MMVDGTPENMPPPLALMAPDWPDLPAGVGTLFTARAGGCSRAPYDDGAGAGGFNLATHVGDQPLAVQQNRALLRQQLPADPAWLNQVHGNTVINVATIGAAVPDADASIATAARQVCVIQTADCLPLLFCDMAGQVVGAAHAGWRGLAAGVVENTLALMRAAGAGEITVWLGPAIGPTQFEVGEEVLQAFAAQDAGAASAFQRLPMAPGKYHADLYQLARRRLKQAGIHRISGGEFCTVQQSHLFYSYRRDGATGRMASLIWIK